MSTRTLTEAIDQPHEARVDASIRSLVLVSALAASLVGCDRTRDEGAVQFEQKSKVVQLIGWTADEQALLIRMVDLSGSGDALEVECDSTGIWVVRFNDQRTSRFGSAEWCKRAPLITAAAFDGSRDVLAYADFASPEGLTLHSGGRRIEIALRGCGGQVHGLALAEGSHQFAVVAACDGSHRLLVGRLPESPSDGEHVTLAAVASGVLGRPAWLGRGNRIAVSMADANGEESIRVVDTLGAYVAVVRSGFSPAGNRESTNLLFLRDQGPQAIPRRVEVWIREGGIGPERQLVSVEFCGALSPTGRVDADLAWSPTGSRIAVRAGSCIWLVRDLSGTPQVTELRSR